MQRKALLVVYLALFVDMLGFGVILPLLPFRIEQLGGTGAWVGAVLTAYALAQFVMAPVLGAMSDRYGRRPLLLASLAGSAVSLALVGFADSLVMLLAARVVAGLCGGAIAVGQAYAVDLSDPEHRTRALGMVGASIGMGFVIGPAIGAALAGLGFTGVSLAAAGIALINLLAGMVLLPRRPGPNDAVPPRRTPGAHTALAHAIRLPTLRPVVAAVFVSMCAFAAMEATYALLGARRYGLGPAGLGLVFTGVGVVMAVVQGGVAGRAADRFGNRRVAVAGAALLGAGLAVLPFTPPWLGYPALALVAAGQGLLGTTAAALIADAGGRALGGMLGVGQAAAAAARALGPIAAGVAFDLRPGLPYYLGAALCGLAAVLLLRSGRAHARATTIETGQPA
ncbi:MFS transporter [Dactylosporangium sucinum]|uniref:Tetracycline resistance MFS efflux pump n=1 Tax=Dactylosporangium sucinum TaxID=1424081 RepID=A0A917U0F5_9ACTN|nr:MFS transporter [Dactylosporangium sucinum]GGM48571.1 tetracycline resistance MFS efflux pump [Dactylosporangium sucinum]